MVVPAQRHNPSQTNLYSDLLRDKLLNKELFNQCLAAAYISRILLMMDKHYQLVGADRLLPTSLEGRGEGVINRNFLCLFSVSNCNPNQYILLNISVRAEMCSQYNLKLG